MLLTLILSDRDLHESVFLVIVRSGTLQGLHQEAWRDTQLQVLRGGRAQPLEGVSIAF